MSAAGGQRGLNGMRFGRGGRIGDLRALLVPPDWFFAVRAGVELVVGAWLVVLLPVLAVFVTTSSMDAAAALSLGKALRVGTGLWSLGLGGSYGRASSPAGVLGLPLLGVTLLQALIARSSVRRARLSGSRAGAWTVTTSVLTAAAVAALSGPAGSRTGGPVDRRGRIRPSPWPAPPRRPWPSSPASRGWPPSSAAPDACPDCTAR